MAALAGVAGALRPPPIKPGYRPHEADFTEIAEQFHDPGLSIGHGQAPPAAWHPIMRKPPLILGLALFAGNALAANINIGPNGCSLADAIRSANSDSAVGNCASGSGTDFIIAPDGWVVTLSSPLPTITSNLTIRSASDAGLFTIDGNGAHRVLKITGSGTGVTLQRLRITGGHTAFPDAEQGPAIRIEDATVHLEDSIVSGNSGSSFKTAGIFVTDGNLTISASAVQDNTVTGLRVVDSTVHIVDSAFVSNGFAEMTLLSGSVAIEGSLIAAQRFAISAYEVVLDITNTTIQIAAPDEYARVIVTFWADAHVALSHVILGTGGREVTEIYGTVHSASNSFIGRCELKSAGQVLLSTGNLYHSTAGSAAPNCLGLPADDHGLLPLADNGGPTWTRAIGDPNSAAINAGDPAYCEALDQRGESRSANCDVGPFEVSESADVSVLGSVQPGTPYGSQQRITYYAAIENSGPGPASHVEIDLDVDGAQITGVDSAFCSTFPCVVTSIQSGQTVVIPVEMTLFGHFSGPFSVDLSAHSTANSTYDDADENDPNGNNHHNVSHPINAAADLAVTLDLDSEGPFFNGQMLAYTTLIENLGPQTASGVELQFAPDNLTGVSFTGCTAVSGNVCSVANIVSGSSRSISIQAIVADEQFNAVGSVTASQLDIDTSNNVDNSNNGGGVSKADVTVQLSLQQAGPYFSYQYLAFDIELSTGEDAASNIQLFYEFPGAELIDIQGCTSYPCVIPSLAANSAIQLTAQFFAPFAVPGVIDSFRLRVLATPGQQEAEPSDNEDEIVRALAPTADIAAQLNLLSPPPFYAGQEVLYALRVPNAGLNAANSVNITHLPQNLTLVSAFGNLCQTVDCNIPRLNAFDEENLTLIYRIDQPGDFDLAVTASANEFDGSPGNNTDSSNNGGFALQPPLDEWIFADGLE